ncbi:hypothetical protein F5Y19DRAFT_461775 [Xylariaceae sp. FL1651]|nr:hypothetical protein F5Y19DRAFT_461775 [Xylariaceae sp. FL1651]
MSISAPQLVDPANDVVYATPEQFHPKPLIADILRTRFCVPDSIFLVEGVDIAHTSESKRWRAIRLLLGDGELCIQSLLSTEMHRFVDRGEIAFGSYVKLQQFHLEWRDVSRNRVPKESDTKGTALLQKREQMVYLVVEDLVVVGWNSTLTGPLIGNKPETRSDFINLGKVQDDFQAPTLATEAKQTQPPNQAIAAHRATEEHDEIVDVDSDFEVNAISSDRAKQNRVNLSTATNSGRLSWSSKDPTKPLKLTNLRSIPNLPYKQNWSVNILCVVSAISDVEPAGIPPYTQRQARLADPSTDKHVLLTVFLDPHLFNPSIGSAVMLLGVKNHRFDGGSLKKYASDRPKAGENWWYENPTQLSWCDVDGLRRWWKERGN